MFDAETLRGAMVVLTPRTSACEGGFGMSNAEFKQQMSNGGDEFI